MERTGPLLELDARVELLPSPKSDTAVRRAAATERNPVRGTGFGESESPPVRSITGTGFSGFFS